MYPIHFTANFAVQVTLSADGMVLRLYLEKVKRWMSEGRKAEAAALMQEMFKRPDEFWRADLLKWSQVAKRILRTDNTYKTAFLQPIYAFEELGLMMLSMAEQVEDREDRLSMIQQVIIKKVSLSSLTAFCLFQVATEAKKWVSRINKAEAARNKYLKKIPRTLIRCGELLLEEGNAGEAVPSGVSDTRSSEAAMPKASQKLKPRSRWEMCATTDNTSS